MNKRIKELAEQATSIVESPPNREGWTSSYTYFDKEKFAELIVRESVAVADDYVRDCTCEEHINCKHPKSAIGRKIREHFGVEE